MVRFGTSTTSPLHPTAMGLHELCPRLGLPGRKDVEEFGGKAWREVIGALDTFPCEISEVWEVSIRLVVPDGGGLKKEGRVMVCRVLGLLFFFFTMPESAFLHCISYSNVSLSFLEFFDSVERSLPSA
ncbi:hypothetical protein K435DRAFT_202647 [Dendrothele bispora CBS 962.96]|uniref:Uncharacterized protein n=1 Tax=Dendrothele bispora (strain CBS 962.96) TaxID=1314807 RepID=A0A4S8MN77_DENBC|nr:hypothetical protein K435DRAFT_202647 [Dendrothele bispora CBS 962.96]